MPFSATDLVWGLAFPAAWAATAVFVAGRLGKEKAAVIGGTAAVAGGYFLSYILLGFGPLWPRNPEHWLPYAIALAITAGTALELASRKGWSDESKQATSRRACPGGWIRRHFLTLAFKLFIAAIAAWLLIPTWPELRHTRLFWILWLAAIIVVNWQVLSTSRKWPLFPLPILALAVVALCGAAILASYVSLSFGQHLAIMAAILGGVGIASFWCKESPLIGLAPAVAALLPGLMTLGNRYNTSAAPFWSFPLISLAPLLLGINLLQFPQWFPKRAVPWLAAGLTLASAFLGLTLALIAASGETAEW